MEECSPCSTSWPFYTFQPPPPNTPNRFVFLINSLKHGQITVTRSLKIAKFFPSPLVPRKTPSFVKIYILQHPYHNVKDSLQQLPVWTVFSLICLFSGRGCHSNLQCLSFSIMGLQKKLPCLKQLAAAGITDFHMDLLSLFLIEPAIKCGVRENHFPVCKQLFYPIASVLCYPGALQFCEVPFINCWS